MRPAAYVLTLLVAALLSGVLAYAGVWTVRVAGCRMLDRPGAFLAYCDTPAFGSYEHAAYGLGFEPEAIRSMQAASVLFLGNSRLQFAFSTAQTDAFFKEIGSSYHLLGFGYGESSAFPRDLIARYPPHPKLVVINADPFFQPVFSPAAYDMMRAKLAARVDAALKQAFGRLHPTLCAIGVLCDGTVPATYRDIGTGQWIWHDLTFPREVRGPVITATKTQPWRAESLPRWVQDADSFLAALPVPRSCVILVGVPTPHVDSEGMAAAIGARLGVPVIGVAVAGLESHDGSHLTADAAGRWSQAFFEAARPIVDACLAR